LESSGHKEVAIISYMPEKEWKLYIQITTLKDPLPGGVFLGVSSVASEMFCAGRRMQYTCKSTGQGKDKSCTSSI